jgi:transcriptional regulator with XRE-family HTH domain
MAFAAFGGAGLFLFVTSLADIVGHLLVETFDLAGALGVTFLACVNEGLMFFVVEGHIPVFGGEGDGISGQGEAGAYQGQGYGSKKFLHDGTPFDGWFWIMFCNPFVLKIAGNQPAFYRHLPACDPMSGYPRMFRCTLFMDYTEKTEKIQPPAVAIDGAKARTIREAKRLTQLYVASVVGVTTDTISRWENNRSPSIKRDNADKLAAALDVALEEILKEEAPPASATSAPQDTLPDPIPAMPPRRRNRFVIGLTLLTVSAGLLMFLIRPTPAVPSATRWAPANAMPGAVIPVKIQIQRPADDTRGFIVKERLPVGWKILQTAPTSVATGQVPEMKWLIPAGTGSVSILYTVQIPVNAPLNSRGTLAGELILQDQGTPRPEPIRGEQQLQITGVHWADQNGDHRIDDTEIMPAYYLCEEFRPLGLEWKLIETIWNSRGYAWDTTTRTVRPIP